MFRRSIGSALLKHILDLGINYINDRITTSLYSNSSIAKNYFFLVEDITPESCYCKRNASQKSTHFTCSNLLWDLNAQQGGHRRKEYFFVEIPMGSINASQQQDGNDSVVNDADNGKDNDCAAVIAAASACSYVEVEKIDDACQTMANRNYGLICSFSKVFSSNTNEGTYSTWLLASLR